MYNCLNKVSNYDFKLNYDYEIETIDSSKS